MNPVTIIRARGAFPHIDTVGNLALDLSRVPKSLRAEVVALARQHKADIIHILGAAPAVPAHVREFCLLAGYELHDWTPAACRGLLDQLMVEWPAFTVKGWHGCDYPESWPSDVLIAVQTVYVMSIQDEGGVQ